jgi:hypothetical protein
MSIPLERTKYDGLAAGITLMRLEINRINRARTDAGQTGRIAGSQIQVKALYQSTKTGLAVLGIYAVALFSFIHRSKRMLASNLFPKTDRLAEAGIQYSVGTTGDSYDNALVESIIGLFKTEVIYSRGPGKSIDPVEYATLEWVDWFNHRRLLGPIGNVPPAEFEQAYYY